MKNCNIIVILICVIILLWSCNSQLYTSMKDTKLSDRNIIKNKSIELANDILNRYCKKDKNRIKYWDGSLSSPRKDYRNYASDSLNIIPIPLYKITGEIEDYEEKIVDGLSWDKKELSGFYTIKNGSVYGFFDWSGVYNFNLSKDCAYLDHDNFLREDNLIWLGYDYLEKNKRSLEFLFGVRYFVNTLWFIENNKIHLLNLKEMKVYDPDEFIKLKCYDGFVRDIAEGGQVTCNH